MSLSINSQASNITPDTAVKVLRGQTPAPEFERPETETPTDVPHTEVVQAVGEIESFISSHSRQLEFSVHEDSGHTVVTVREPNNGDVIRQIPNEQVLAVAADIRNRIRQSDTSGILFNKST